MSIRLDPRRLAALKLLASEAGMRPGELVTAWVEERLDAARSGTPAAAAPSAGALADLTARVDELARRVDDLGAAAVGARTEEAATTPRPATQEAAATPRPATQEAAAPDEATRTPRRGRPPKERAAGEPEERAGRRRPSSEAAAQRRVPLHEEIEAVIAERGPLSAAEIADAIAERGRYAAPRSTRPLDAATVNSRVSNPAYRSRFARSDGRIGLASGSASALASSE